jgi:hypothetical protein
VASILTTGAPTSEAHDKHEMKAALALVAVTPPIPGRQIEHDFSFGHAGHVWRGTADMLAPGLVVDHKTTRSLKYALASYELERDPQARLYAASAASDDKSSTITARWQYVEVKNWIQTHVIEHTFVRVTRSQLLTPLLETADAIAAIRRAAPASALEVVATPGQACYDYGGCPHVRSCPDARQTQNKKPEKTYMISKKTKLETQLENSLKIVKGEMTGGVDVVEPAELVTLYVRSAPLRPQLRQLDIATLVDAANQEVCEKYDVVHWSAVDFGKGGGYLAVAIEEALDACEGLPYDIVVHLDVPPPVLALLAARAQHVVRGF